MQTIYPALIITFARPEGLLRLLNIGIDSGVKKFYVAVDGPRTEKQHELQREIGRILDEFRLRQEIELHVWHRDKNLGAAVSVLTAVNWFFANEKAGYILEDDLVPSPDFFTFTAKALDLYQDNSDVWLISGSRMIAQELTAKSNAWSFYPMIWGWGTWAGKWELMFKSLTDQSPKEYLNFFDRRANFWQIGSKRSQNGFVDAWDIPLANAQFRRGKFTVIPPVNLVTNIGYDENATHTSGTHFPLNHPYQTLPVEFYLDEAVSAQKAKLYDALLEESLFRIKLRHKFLRIYSPIMDWYRFREMVGIPLLNRILEVDTPIEPKSRDR